MAQMSSRMRMVKNLKKIAKANLNSERFTIDTLIMRKVNNSYIVSILTRTGSPKVFICHSIDEAAEKSKELLNSFPVKNRIIDSSTEEDEEAMSLEEAAEAINNDRKL